MWPPPFFLLPSLSFRCNLLPSLCQKRVKAKAQSLAGYGRHASTKRDEEDLKYQNPGHQPPRRQRCEAARCVEDMVSWDFAAILSSSWPSPSALVAWRGPSHRGCSDLAPCRRWMFIKMTKDRRSWDPWLYMAISLSTVITQTRNHKSTRLFASFDWHIFFLYLVSFWKSHIFFEINREKMLVKIFLFFHLELTKSSCECMKRMVGFV